MILYIIDYFSLEIKEVLTLSYYEINVDEETNSNSKITLSKKPNNINKKDYLVLNENENQLFLGIIDSFSNQKNENKIEIIAKHISNIFNTEIIEKDLNVMTDASIETFIYNTIINDFISSDDEYSNMKYIELEKLTDTKGYQETLSNNTIYNFYTFLVNARKNFNIFLTYKIFKNKLKISIEHKNYEVQKIDTTISEIVNYNKVYEDTTLSKITIKCGDTDNIKKYYLKIDGTITEDSADVNRLSGTSKVIYVSKEEDAYQEAEKAFKNNSYSHLVDFSIKKDSKLIDTSNLIIGAPIEIKTKDGIYTSYISAYTIKNNEKYVSFKTGNIRTDLTSKINLEMNKILSNFSNISQNVIMPNDEIETIYEGSIYLNASQSISIPNLLSSYKTGIAIFWSAYSDGKPNNWNWKITFIPKFAGSYLNGAGVFEILGGTNGVEASKYFYIYDDKIEGNDSNNKNGYVLRKVVGF